MPLVLLLIKRKRYFLHLWLMDNMTISQIEDSSVVFVALRTSFTFVLGLLIISGNVLSVAVTWHIRDLADSTKVLMTSLAVCDLLVGVFTVFYSITSGLDRWPFGQLGCRIVALMAAVSLFMSIVCITLLNIDRYIAVTRPLRFHVLCSKRRTIACVIILACLCLTFLVTNAFMFDVQFSYNRFTALCFSPIDKWINEVITLCLYDVLPALIIIVIYCRIIQISRRHAIFINQQGANTGNVSKKALQTFLIVTLLFSACWTPLFMSRVIPGVLPITIPNWVNFLTNWLATSNSLFNVVVYCGFNKSFRRTAKQILVRNLRICQTSVQPVVD